MSTAGKVLVVLVMLVAPVWLLLISAVAQLNMNGGAEVARLQKDVEKLEQDQAAMRKSIVNLKDQITLEQLAMNEHINVLRSHQTELQKARSEAQEFASRVSLQVASTQQQAKSAAANNERRQAERQEVITAKATAEAEVEQLKQEHASLVEQLDKLRNDFKTTVDANRKLVDLLKAGKSS